MLYKTWIEYEQNKEYAHFFIIQLLGELSKLVSFQVTLEIKVLIIFKPSVLQDLIKKQLTAWGNCNFIFISTPVAMLPSDQILQIYYRAVLNPVAPYNLPAHVLNDYCRLLVFLPFTYIIFFQMTWFLEKLRAEQWLPGFQIRGQFWTFLQFWGNRYLEFICI